MSLELSETPTVNVGMLIRRPPEAVFEALADPSVTTRFWFTNSSGSLDQGANVQWDWEMYGVSAEVAVQEAEENRRLLFDWGPKDGPEDAATTVEVNFVPHGDDSTYVQVTETGFSGSPDEIVARAIDSTGGFTMVLCALKALLEHDVELSAVADKAPPPGVEV